MDSSPKKLLFRQKEYEIEGTQEVNGFTYYKVKGFTGSLREDIITLISEPKTETKPKKATKPKKVLIPAIS